MKGEITLIVTVEVHKNFYYITNKCNNDRDSGNRRIAYCKQTFIRKREIFTMFARASLLRIFLAAKQPLSCC